LLRFPLRPYGASARQVARNDTAQAAPRRGGGHDNGGDSDPNPPPFM